MTHPAMRTRKWLVPSILSIAYILHQDVWNWTAAQPLFFGVVPPGLAYHAAYTVLVACLMAILVRYAWPDHLESKHEAEPRTQPGPPKP
jgi:hypothetical protein